MRVYITYTILVRTARMEFWPIDKFDLCRRIGGLSFSAPGVLSKGRIGHRRGHQGTETTVQGIHDLTRRRLLAGAGALPLLLGGSAGAAEYPTRPVKVVIPYPPAGGADTVGRILFQKLGEMWGQQFVIDNRGGAGGTIAAAAVAKAEHDGYTIMYDATAFSVNPSLYPRLPYDAVKDFAPIFLSALITNLLV